MNERRGFDIRFIRNGSTQATSSQHAVLADSFLWSVQLSRDEGGSEVANHHALIRDP
jgi:hypothetical protein